MPSNESIGYPPENIFIPKVLIEKKAARVLDSDKVYPIKISENPSIWFK